MLISVDDNSRAIRLTSADHRLLEFPIGHQLIQLIESDTMTIKEFTEKHDYKNLLKLLTEGREKGFEKESDKIKKLFLEVLNTMHVYFGNSSEIVESDMAFLSNIENNILKIREIVNLLLINDTQESIKSLSATHKLYILNINWTMLFGDDISLKVSFVPSTKTEQLEDYVHDLEKAALDRSIEIAERIKDEKFETYQIYECDILKLCYLEIVKMLTLGIVVGKCPNCGRYFVITGRTDTEYCDRIAPGYSDRTCKDIGPLKDYTKRIKDNPLLLAYQKAYKAKHAELRKIKNPVRYEEEKENLKQWRISAKVRAEKGEVLDEFKKWLN